MRSKIDVLAAEPAVVGMEFPSRDSNELYVCKIYESKGKLMSYSKPGMQKTATDLVIGCSDPSCGGWFHYRLSYKGQWALTKVVACTCTGATYGLWDPHCSPMRSNGAHRPSPQHHTHLLLEVVHSLGAPALWAWGVR